MADKEHGNGTMQITRITLFNMLEFAKDNDIIARNPCKKSVKSNMGKSTTEKKVLEIDEQEKFLKCIEGHRYELPFRFILQTGLRVGELTGLKWEDVDFQKKTISVRRNVGFDYNKKEWITGDPKTKSGFRTIPLTDEAISILKRQKSKNRTLKIIPIEWKEYVFLGVDGMPVKNPTYPDAIHLICRKNDIRKFSIHILRHTFATRCIEAGMKPVTLQKILGYSNVGVTMNRYVTTTEDEKRKEMEGVAEALVLSKTL